jgi:hypothetical protein
MAVEPQAVVVSGPQHFLESEWVIWEHRAPHRAEDQLVRMKQYEGNMCKVCEIATIEDFWRAFNNIPKPSQLFYDGKTKKKFANRTVEAFSLFKKNIKPEWEDPANRFGAEWQCRKMMPLQQLDELWRDLALGMIGETIDPLDDICGARVVDKSVGTRQLFRLELWFKRNDLSVADELKKRMNEHLGPAAEKACKWEMKPHGVTP